MTDHNQNDVLKAAKDSLRRSSETINSAAKQDTRPSGASDDRLEQLLKMDGVSDVVAGAGKMRTMMRGAWDKAVEYKNRAADSFAWKFTSPVIGTAFNVLKWGFNKAAYTKQEDGTKKFAMKGAAIFLASVLTLPYWGGVAAELVEDGMVASTQRDVAAYVMDSYPVKGEEDTYDIVVKYDKTKPPTEENTDYFRIKPNFWLNAKGWATKVHPFLPENISQVARAAGGEQCKLTYGGVRIRPLHYYYTATGIDCGQHGQAAPESVAPVQSPTSHNNSSTPSILERLVM